MCGIAGIITSREPKDYSNWSNSTLRSLQHRGPDDSGWLTIGRNNHIERGRHRMLASESCVYLLHRRLSIIDLSDGGWQPMSAFSDLIHIVFNGEIYNYLELKFELIELGYTFSSDSDTEVLLCAYHRWNVDCVKHFVGMFSFVIVDLRTNVIFGARDHFGIKPFYYTKNGNNEFIFSSEVSPLLQFSSKKIRAKGAFSYLRYGITDNSFGTLFDDIFQLEAGCFFVFSLKNVGDIVQHRYWSLDISNQSDLSFQSAVDKTRELFFENMKLHLRSDVPIGFALSGGMDSSAIVAAARKILPEIELHTFSYDAVDVNLSEKKWFDLVSSEMNTHQHLIRVSTAEMLIDLPQLIRIHGEPFSSTSMYAQFRIFQEAKRAGVTVMLDGQGGDELLGGYTSYYGARIASMIKNFDVNGIVSIFSSLNNTVGIKKLLPLVGNFVIPANLQGLMRQLVGEQVVPSWLRSQWFVEQGVQFDPIRSNYPGKFQLKADLFASLFENTLPRLLRFEDRNSMIHSVESRVPFLTAQFAEFALSLPENFLISNTGTTKSVFREAMRGIVPDAVIDRKDKIGFNTPERNWMLEIQPFVEKCLASETFNNLPMLNQSEIHKDWANIVSGNARFDFRVWRWVNFVLWSEEFEVKFS